MLLQLMPRDRKSTRLNSSHVEISYAVFCLKKKKQDLQQTDATFYCPCLITSKLLMAGCLSDPPACRGRISFPVFRLCFFFSATASTESYTLSLHDALPI